MFKKISILICAFMLVMLMGQASIMAAENDNVKDFLNYLSDSEVTELQDSIEKVKNDYSLDVVIVITDKTEGKSSMAFADDYYDYNGYGVGSDHSGLLMLVNMDKREVWISTAGRAIDIFTDSRISNMVDHVTGFLSKGNYFDACTTFIEDVRSYANMGVPAGQYRKEVKVKEGRTYLQRVWDLMKSPIVYIISLVIGLIATIIASLSSQGKVTISNRTYEEEGSFKLSESRDDFIRETTTRIKIAKDSGSSGRSSTHTGSSGRSHGGGGGRF